MIEDSVLHPEQVPSPSGDQPEKRTEDNESVAIPLLPLITLVADLGTNGGLWVGRGAGQWWCIPAPLAGPVRSALTAVLTHGPDPAAPKTHTDGKACRRLLKTDPVAARES
jgi:hypothetical protein